VSTARLLCDRSSCTRKTFAERFPELVAPYGRRTLLLRRILETMALALGGRPAAKLTRRPCVEVSRSTLLRLLRALPVPEVGFCLRLVSTTSRSGAATPTGPC
jgi:hypothetical protein